MSSGMPRVGRKVMCRRVSVCPNAQTGINGSPGVYVRETIVLFLTLNTRIW